MKIPLFFRLSFAVLLAFTVSTFVYFGFVNSYSSTIFNHQNFQEQFQSGIYQYRILSSYLLLWIYDFLGTFKIDYQIFKLKFLDKSAEPRMFLAFYMVNTLFLALSAFFLVLIMEAKNFVAINSEKILITVVAIFTICISQFVIVPYDVASYFLLLLFYYFLLKYVKKLDFSTLIILGIILLISTLIRESSALSISLAATLLFTQYKFKKEAFLPVSFLVLMFLIAYVGIRVLHQDFTTTDGNLLSQNLSQPKNFLGIILWIMFLSLSLFLAKDKKAVRAILVFHALSLPYVYVCFYSGILYEIRLYVPIFLTSLLLARTELGKFR
ncbi:hypothetical protein SAMN05421638_1622 [Kaistella treverensis]|uniref:Uncharacterized protein n=1 Tax=Kaistella treverensis TaxID=631455 RepID=A0A1I3MA34_9FLAO|nr:hypothetical protein [Kaistella treverensis]SFI93838.1 hypothetical protein SAMN05421638_1622 [Kaistella treverensis]